MDKIEAQNVKLKQRNRKLKYELDKLKEIEKEHKKINGELRKENKQLKSILTELEEWLKSIMENASLKWGDNCEREYDLGCLDIEMAMKNYGEVLNKIQKLKEKYK